MNSSSQHPADLRTRLADARLMLLFSPALCAGRDPVTQLEAALPHVDVVQVRPKPVGSSSAPAPARATLELARVVLERAKHCARAPLVLVDDRVDVARLLWAEGLAGVHLGEQDTPPPEARELLGRQPLIGLSTHSVAAVARAVEQPVDYLGFGPIHATPTKEYVRGLGAELAWIAASGAHVPLFPIGGIDLSNAEQLVQVGRAAVGSALIAAEDPARAARDLRSMLEPTLDAGPGTGPQGRSNMASP